MSKEEVFLGSGEEVLLTVDWGGCGEDVWCVGEVLDGPRHNVPQDGDVFGKA